MEAAQARLSPHLSKCHIVGNHMSRLIYQYHSLVCRLGHKKRATCPAVDLCSRRALDIILEYPGCWKETSGDFTVRCH